MNKKSSSKVDVKSIINAQREFFNTHRTKNVEFRIAMLEKLKQGITKYEKDIIDALNKDLKKSEFESYETEIGIILEEIRLHIKNTKSWSKSQKVKTPLTLFPGKSFVVSEPYGLTLILAPWNYPFQLLMAPLIGAISAGNCVALKPSEISEHTAHIIGHIMSETYDPNYIYTFIGGVDLNKQILQECYDYIFFTGGPVFGKIVMQSAARNLTPVTLELGGKSPCIVEDDANIDLSAKRITWGKYLNAGQTCIAPDYIMAQRSITKELLERIKKYIKIFYGEDPSKSPDYPRIITDNHFARLVNFLKDGTIYFGGENNEKERYIAPTILTGVHPKKFIMQEEIFGPILPIIEYDHLEEAIDFVNKRPRPLAQYFFSENKEKQKIILEKTSFGGGCINDTVVHFINPYMPFGGVGSSGMGGYHGKKSFDTFTHNKSILKSSTLFDNPLKYAPYKGKLGLLKLFVR